MLRKAVRAAFNLKGVKTCSIARAFSAQAIEALSLEDPLVTTQLPNLASSIHEWDKELGPYISGRYEIDEINAVLRPNTKGRDRQRKAGWIPSLLYSLPGEEQKLLLLDAKEINKKINAYGPLGVCSRLFNLTVRDADNVVQLQVPVIGKELHQTATNFALENMTFLYCPPERIVNVRVPVLYIGEDVSPAAKKNGYCHLTRNTIKIKCFGNRVPAYFQIDTSRLNIGVKLRVDVLEPTPYGIAVNEKDWNQPIIRMVSPSGGD